jgi:hypothetical protein
VAYCMQCIFFPTFAVYGHVASSYARWGEEYGASLERLFLAGGYKRDGEPHWGRGVRQYAR